MQEQRQQGGMIEKILSEATASGDPDVMRQSITKILSQVSPERQPGAVKVLESMIGNIQEKQVTARQRKAAQEAGVSPDLAPALQAAQLKENAKAKRLAGYGFNQSGGTNQTPGTPEIPNSPQPPSGGFPIRNWSDDQLVQATGAVDKEIAEPAKAELKRREEQAKIDQKKQSDVFRAELSRSQNVLEKADNIAEQLPQKRTAVNLMKDAVANRNLGFFSPDNLAEMTGIEGFRSQEGAIFKTAGKEYFLGNIARAGARPNQWIEQQISDMMAKIGRSPEANFSVLRALENELDLDEERVRLTNEISDKLKSEGDYAQGKLGTLVTQGLTRYAEKKQQILFNDLRAIKAVADKTPQKFIKVEKGTPVSNYMVQALLLQFGNDPQKARDEAKKLGYEF